jgi:hypothetical protein
MTIRIDEISKIAPMPGDDAGYVRVYVKVLATDGAKSEVMEFHIGRQVVGQAIITDAKGWQLNSDGKYIDPAVAELGGKYTWVYKAVTQDLLAEVLAVVKATAERRLKLPVQDNSLSLKAVVALDDRASLPLAVRQLQGTVVQ